MAWECSENNREKVLEALRSSEYEAILTSKEGALDILVHLGLGIGGILGDSQVDPGGTRDQASPLISPTRRWLLDHFVAAIGLSASANTLFEDATVMPLKLGYTAGTNPEWVQLSPRGKSKRSNRRSRCLYHPDVLR